MMVTVIKKEAQKPGIAVSNAFVLLEWTADILPHTAKSTGSFDVYSADLFTTTVALLDLCLGSAQTRGSLKEQALRVIRRGLRMTFKSPDHVSHIKTTVERLTAKGIGTTQKNALLLGIVSGVCARLPGPRKTLGLVKKDIFSFYVRELLGSRSMVPEHQAYALADFFSAFTTTEDFERELVSPLERSLLRSPEVVLSNLASALFRSLSSSVDLSNSLYQKLIKQLLSCTKSTNSVIRNGVLDAFQNAILHCGDEAAVVEIVDEIMNPLKSGKLTSLDQRISHAKMLEILPASVAVSKKIPAGLAGLASKEPNESVVGVLVSAIIKHLAVGLGLNVPAESPVLDSINKGLMDKRPAIRRVWVLKVADMIWAFDNEPPAARSLCNAIVDKLKAVWYDVSVNPLPAAQNGLASAACAAVAVMLERLPKLADENTTKLLQSSDIVNQSLTVSPKVSFLLNHKVYSKLTADDDHRWVMRALTAVAANVVYENDHAEYWAFAFLYIICAHNISPAAKKSAVSALSSVYMRHSENIGRVMLNGIWQWLRKIEDPAHNKDSAPAFAKTGGLRLRDAVHAIFPSPAVTSVGSETSSLVDESAAKNNLVNLCVLAHHPLMPGVNWISLCQKVGVDPGKLTTEKAPHLVGQVRMYTGLGGRSSHIKKAALISAATLAFVAPDAITPLIVALFEGDLNPRLLQGIGAQEVAIWQTPPDVMFVDVLSKTSMNKTQEKSKDADTLKWEAELRAQLAQKKGTEKKLTPEEKLKVDEQMAKEAAIRTKVVDVELRLQRGVGIIESLAKGVPNDVEAWIGHAVQALLSVIEAGAGMIIRDAAIKALEVKYTVGPREGC